jgi:hypothetical protein
VILSATSLSVFAGLGMMLSLMEGFRRAYRLPRDDWSFWGRRLRALLLVPLRWFRCRWPPWSSSSATRSRLDD